MGSLVAAVGSYLDARAHQGEWWLRIEDVDAPRCSTQAAADILHTLEALGFDWDGEVVWQSRRTEAYRAALERLEALGLAYPCGCTRKELAAAAQAEDGSALYPGICRNGLPRGKTARAWRVRVDEDRICWDDALQGLRRSELAKDSGDFVVLRADGLFAYQLAVVVDDAAAGMTHIVRGVDLLASTPRQIHLQHCLGLPTPIYAHLPIVTNAHGEKLSKQTRAAPLDLRQPQAELFAALQFLGQSPPAELQGASLAELWAWAKANWRRDRVAVCGERGASSKLGAMGFARIAR